MKFLKKFKNKGMLFATPWDGFLSSGVSSNFTTLDGTVAKIAGLIDTLMNFAGLVAVVMLVYGGYMMITSGGDPEKVEKGQSSISGAVIGLIVVFVAKLVIVYVADFLG
jgi:hypothetical protein